jgi:hypothetical protein
MALPKLLVWPRHALVESIVVRLTRADVETLLRDGVLPEYQNPGTTAPSLTVILSVLES